MVRVNYSSVQFCFCIFFVLLIFLSVGIFLSSNVFERWAADQLSLGNYDKAEKSIAVVWLSFLLILCWSECDLFVSTSERLFQFLLLLCAAL